MAQLEKLNINTIDVVCVNLYPFKATLAKGADFAECVENIDIGGPTMIRAAAKNYQDVAVIVDPKDYDKVLEELANGGVSLDTKKYLQYKVFAHTAVYDSLISNYLASQLGITFPDEVTFAYEKAQDMRYGENPDQQAVFYNEQFIRKGSLSSAKQLWGKELSYNNINDANGALELLKEFGKTPAVVACKHANPCGVGTEKTVFEAYMRAYESDLRRPLSVARKHSNAHIARPQQRNSLLAAAFYCVGNSYQRKNFFGIGKIYYRISLLRKLCRSLVCIFGNFYIFKQFAITEVIILTLVLRNGAATYRIFEILHLKAVVGILHNALCKRVV